MLSPANATPALRVLFVCLGMEKKCFILLKYIIENKEVTWSDLREKAIYKKEFEGAFSEDDLTKSNTFLLKRKLIESLSNPERYRVSELGLEIFEAENILLQRDILMSELTLKLSETQINANENTISNNSFIKKITALNLLFAFVVLVISALQYHISLKLLQIEKAKQKTESMDIQELQKRNHPFQPVDSTPFLDTLKNSYKDTLTVK